MTRSPWLALLSFPLLCGCAVNHWQATPDPPRQPERKVRRLTKPIVAADEVLSLIQRGFGAGYHSLVDSGEDASDRNDDIILISAAPLDERKAALVRVGTLFDFLRRTLFDVRFKRRIIIFNPEPKDGDRAVSEAKSILAPVLPQSDGASAGRFAGADQALGLYVPGCGLIVTRDLNDTLAHECVHALHDAWIDYRWKPSWLAEGVALTFEKFDARTKAVSNNDSRMIEAQIAGNPNPIRSLIRVGQDSLPANRYP